MRRPILWLIASLSLPFGASLAEEPSAASTEKAARSSPAPAEQDPGTSTEGSDDSTAVAASADEHAAVESEVEKYFRRLGYVSVKKDGGTYYCRDEAALGTRLKKQVCITEEIARQRRDDARREMEEKFGDRMWKEGMLAPQMPPVR